jgi:molecular chaperone HtpG
MEVKKFQTEVAQLLDLVIHSLYSNKEIFLRELISNASDAIDKAKYEGLTNKEIYEGNTDWKIKLSYDEAAGTLTLNDNGIGMNRKETIKHLGTIAHSGTKEFLAQAQKKNASTEDVEGLIGQFGVGFYSAFMVADKVEVLTRRRGDAADTATLWVSDASGTYSVEDATKDAPGTSITLHMREEEKSILGEFALKRIVTTYSDYIEYPVVMDVEKPVLDDEGKPTDKKETTEEVLNSMKALWLKDKADVSAEDQKEFYKHISHDYVDPLKVVQFKAEGTSEFYALLFIPSHAQFDLFYKDMKIGPMLYVKRVQIMEHCEELLPNYLRFVSGVVESNDLPLNISREILQRNREIPLMQKNIVRKLFEALTQMKEQEPENYKKFYEEFGRVLKEGLHYDFERRQTIAKLLIFESTATAAGDKISFDDYISRMKADQKDIYYITGRNRTECENSPYIEGLKDKGYEVLFMTDEFDDILFTGLAQYGDKTLQSALKGDLGIDAEVKAKKAKSYETLTNRIKDALGGKVSEVRLTTRLSGSPAVLVGGENAPDPAMERMLRSLGQELPEIKRSLELNPDHKLLKAMKKALDADEKNKLIDEYANLLYSQAVLLEGGQIDNMPDFVNKISTLMTEKLG